LKVLVLELGLNEVGNEGEGDPHEDEERNRDYCRELARVALVDSLSDKRD
jgi:hypothetical protein